MKSQRWYLLSLFVIVSVLSFMANGIDRASVSVLAQTLPPSPPPNDNFADALLIDPLPFNTVVDITAATLEPNEPQNYCNYISKSIWYRYEPSVNTLLQVDVNGSNFSDTVLNVWQGDGLMAVTCASGWNASLEFTAAAGQTYYIQTGRIYDEAWGELHLNVTEIPRPPNDDFANAEQVGGLPFNQTQDTTHATTEAGEPRPTCGWNFGGWTVWYAYTPTTSGSLFSYVDADVPHVFAVYTGSALTSLTELGCRDGSNRLVIAAQAGVTYYFQIGSTSTYGGAMSFHLGVAGAPEANFGYNPSDPSLFDTLQFYDNSQDPYGGAIQSQAWNFGDSATAAGCCPTHRYAADGDYTVALAVTTYDGRTASRLQTVTVKTHDVAITKFAAPNSANAGQTRTIVVGLNSRRYEETVEVRLLKSNPGDPWNPWLPVGALTQFVPIRQSNRTTDFNFSYTFTPADAQTGKVSFKAVANLLTGRDALLADNEAIAPPAKVGGKASAASSGDPASLEQNVQIFLPVVAKE